MKLCKGQYKYLLTIDGLSRNLKIVRSVDIANDLSVSRSSVSRTLKCMARLELIEPDYSSSVVLTGLGRDCVKRLSVSFNMVNKFFSEILKLDQHEAYEQSIQFIADFPEDTVDRLTEITEHTLKRRMIKRNKKII